MLAVSASGEAGRHQTALRGQVSFSSEKATVAIDERRLRNLSVPTNRSSKTASSTPFGLTAFGRRRTAGIETRVWSGRPPSGRVGSVHPHSVVGPHRSGDGRVSPGVDDPVTGPGANPNGVGSGVCRSATREVEPQKSVAIGRGRRCCPSSACSSPGRAGGSRNRWSGPVHVFSFEAVLVLLLVRVTPTVTHAARNRFASKGTCLRHRW